MTEAVGAGRLEFVRLRTDAEQQGRGLLEFGQAPEPYIPPPISGHVAVRWGASAGAGGAAALPWQQAQPESGAAALVWGDSDGFGAPLAATWDSLESVGGAMRPTWRNTETVAAAMEAVWRTLSPIAGGRSLSWGLGEGVLADLRLAWRQLSPQSARLLARWESGAPVSRDLDVFWRQLRLMHQPLDAVWGHGVEPWGRYPPPPPPPPEPPEPPPSNEVVGRAALVFRCRSPLRWRPGHSRIDFGELCPLYGGTSVFNSGVVVRLPGRESIPVDSVSLVDDIDSYAITGSLSVLTDAALDLLRPAIGALQEVEITLNGHVWRLLIDGWSRSRQHGQTTISVSGRSPSCVQARPFAPGRSWVQPATPYTAQQIALELLQGTGLALDWRIDDWLVPASVADYHDFTPIAAVADIADAAGATLRTSRDGQSLIVAYRYPVMPWAWANTAPDRILPATGMPKLPEQYEAGPAYNRAWAAGERTGGILYELTRDGTAGDVPAPKPVTHKLITATEAARPRAARVLAESVPKIRVSVDLPLYPAEMSPGLLEVGQIVQIPDGRRGQVVGTKIDAKRQKAGKGTVLVIWQSAEIELAA